MTDSPFLDPSDPHYSDTPSVDEHPLEGHSTTCLYAKGQSAEPDREVCPACAEMPEHSLEGGGRSAELRIADGPVVIVQTTTDPGDMGEPRVITEDGATVVFVPAFNLWPEDGYLLVSEAELAEALRLARMLEVEHVTLRGPAHDVRGAARLGGYCDVCNAIDAALAKQQEDRNA